MGAMKEKWATEMDLKLIEGAYIKTSRGDIAKVLQVGLLMRNEDGQYEDHILVEYVTNKNGERRMTYNQPFWTYILPLDAVEEIVDSKTCEALYLPVQ